MIHAARKAGTFLGEAFMYRLHPQTAKLVELVKSGAIGEVRHDQVELRLRHAAASCRSTGSTPTTSPAAASSMSAAIPVSMARLIAGAAAGKPFARAGQGGGRRRISASPASTNGRRRCCIFPNGIVAEVSCCDLARPGQRAAHPRHQGPHRGRRISGSPAASEGGTGKIDIIRPDGSARRSRSTRTRWLYSFEADAAGEAIRAGRQEFAWPGMGWADSLGNLRVLDKWRAGGRARIRHREGRARASTRSPAGRCAPAARRSRKRAIPGLAQPASVVALGFEDFRTFSSGVDPARRLLRGAAAICSTPPSSMARGHTEALLGEWLTQPRRARAVGDHRQGRALAALLSRRDRQAADAVARPAEDRPCRRLFHAPRQSRRAGRRVRRRHGRARSRPAASADRSAARTGPRERMDEAIAYAEQDRQAEARRALQQFLAGRDARRRSGRAASPPPTTTGRPG